MEIIQTIWIALTTNNEILTNIICIPLAFIESTAIIFLSISLLNLKINKKKIISFILSLSIVSVLNIFFLPEALKATINLLFIPLFAVFVFKVNFFKGLLIEFIPIIVVLISETIWSNFADLVFNISVDEYLNVPIYKLIMSILDYVSMFFVYILSKKYNINIALLDNIPKKSKTILTLNSIIGIIAIATQLYLIAFYVQLLPYFITIVALLSLLAYFCISMYSLINTSRLAITTTDLEQEKENNRILTEMQDELRGFRHDFANIICTLLTFTPNIRL